MAWFFRNWRNDDKGSVLPIAAVAILLSAALIGSGVDLSRAYRAKNRLQSACDAAVLAGRRAETSNGFDQKAEAQAEAFFNANFNDDRQDTHDTSFEPYSDDNGETVKGIARTTSANLLMSLFGFEEVALKVECQASMGIGNSDVVMVLDTTGSMDWNMDGYGNSGERMKALKEAMKNFYITVQSSTSGTNARVRYGFVPYSSSVNIGRILYETDPDYLADVWTYPTRKAITRSEEVFDHWGDPVRSSANSTEETAGDWNIYRRTGYRRRDDCEDTLPSNTPWSTETPPDPQGSVQVNSQGQQVTTNRTTKRQSRREYACRPYFRYYVPYYRDVTRDEHSYETETRDPVYSTKEVFDHWSYYQHEHDTSVFKTGVAVTAAIGDVDSRTGVPRDMTSRWNGCVQARATKSAATFTFSSVAGMRPTGAHDLDLDLVPDDDPDTKWGPMWPEVTFKRTREVNRNVYLAKNKSDAGIRMDQPGDVVCPKEAQLLATMEQADFDAYADALEPKGGTYLDVGLIWGGRLLSEEGVFADNVNAAPDNGGEVSRHLIFLTDGEMAPNIDTLTAYGIEFFDRKTTPGTESNTNVGAGCCHSDRKDVERHNSRFFAVCKAIKAKGIRLWTIAFTNSSTSNLDDCASGGSSFNAKNAEELNEAFQEIAKQVGELRIIK